MTKITLSTVGNLIDATTAATTINNNFSTIQTAMDNTYSRDGTSPNTLLDTVDANSKQIINLPNPATADSPLRLRDLNQFIGGGTISNIPTGGLTNQALVKNSNTNYDLSWLTVPLIIGGVFDLTGVTVTGGTYTAPSMTNVSITGSGNSLSVTGKSLFQGTGGVVQLIPSPTRMLVVEGSIGTPVTTDQPTVLISRYETITNPVTVANAALYAVNVGGLGGAPQTSALAGWAYQLGSGDAMGVGGKAEIHTAAGSNRAAIALAGEARAYATGSSAQGIELQIHNQSGNSAGYFADLGTRQNFLGIDINYYSPAGDLGSVGIYFRADTGRLDVGIGFGRYNGFSPIVTADIQSDTDAVNILLANSGAHTNGINLTGTGSTYSGSAFMSPGFSVSGTGAIVGTKFNGNTWTTGTGVLTIAAAKTATVNNTLTFTGTDGSSVNFGAGGTIIYSSSAAGGDLTGTYPNPTITNITTGTTVAGTLVHTKIAAPSSPAAGKVTVWSDTTDNRLHDKNSSGVIGTTVTADTGTSNNFLTAISAAGVISKAQPAFSNLSGSVAASQMPALTGDITTVAGAVATTLATVNSNVGTFGSATQSAVPVVNGKGLITAISNVTITPAVGSVTGLGTGVATALGVNVGSAGAFVVNGGALGTPSSGSIATTLLTGILQAAQAPAHTGDVTSSAGAVALTIATNAVTNAKSAQMAAVTIKGNPTNATANATDFTIQGLTDITNPHITLDWLPIYDHVAGTIKKTTASELVTAVSPGVTSFNTRIGAVTAAAADYTAAQIGANGVFYKTKIVKFTANGTYTPTTGMVYCIIECLGGGGGGGGTIAMATGMGSGGGGGAGSYSRLVASAATIGASKAVTIGTAAAGGTAGGGYGANGADVSVGTLCIGKGGTGASGNGGAGAFGGLGGVAGTGDLVSYGACGGVGYGSTTTALYGLSANGASSMWGQGGLGGNVVSGNTATGADALGYGSGGAGGLSYGSASGAAGGAGTPGIVVITEFINQ